MAFSFITGNASNVSPVPNDGEIEFILDLMDTVISPTLDTVEKILDLPTWDEVARNDFCR